MVPAACSDGGSAPAPVWCEREELLASMYDLHHLPCSALQSQERIANFCDMLKRFVDHLVRQRCFAALPGRPLCLLLGGPEYAS